MERSAWTDLAGALSLGAALVHAAAAGTHTGDASLVALFAVTAVVQGAVGVVLLRSPTRSALIGAGLLNLAFVGAWVLSRTVGLPIVDSLSEVEAVGRQDLAAALLAAGSALASLLARRPASTPSSSRLGWLPIVAIVPALVGVAAPHAHDTSHEHDHGHDTEAAAAADHPEEGGELHEHQAEPAAGTLALASAPVLMGADTGHATEAELTAAVDLVESTRAVVDPDMTVAEAEAAGYVWIGDGRRPGRYQHYINHEYVTDGIDLDPNRIESLVFQNTGGEPKLVTTMFVLAPGMTMDDVPEVAGDLTVWHDHQNLCWDETGTKLAGISVDGKTCRPAGELRASPPMLHVWLIDNECGPFAGIEGHGADGCASHEH